MSSAQKWFEDLQRWLESMGVQQGRSNGGGGGGIKRPPGAPGVPGRFVQAIVVSLILFIAVMGSYYTVDISEEGVVTRFGRYVETTPSGLHFKLPFGIDRVQKVPSKVTLIAEFGFRSKSDSGSRTQYSTQGFDDESLMLTGDLNVADVEWIVKYRIRDSWKFLFHARNVEQAIRDVSVSIMRRVVGDRLVGDVLTVGRVEIADAAKVLTQEVLDRYDMGIKIEEIILQDVNPPEAVKPAFNEVNAAKQEQEQIINNAEREYNMIIPEARGKGQQVQADAEAYAIAAVNRAKGDAARFSAVLAEYRKAPDVTKKRMYLETMEEVFANMQRLVVVDSNVKGILPLYGAPAEVVKPVETKPEGGK
jgi:modulator of FtsH protease HflK